MINKITVYMKQGLLDLLKGYKKFEKDPNLLILGLDNVGKTTLFHNLTQEKVKTTEPTQGSILKLLSKRGSLSMFGT